MITHFIVGWNNDAKSRSALNWVLERDDVKEITLVRVLDKDEAGVKFLVAGPAVDAVREQLDAEVAALRESHPTLTIDSELVHGDAVKELVRYSTPDQTLVVGSSNRHEQRKLKRWSVSVRVAARIRGPLAIIPDVEPLQRSGIVVGLDGSWASDRALLFAAEEGRRTHESVTVVHTWMEPAVFQVAYVPDQSDVDSLEAMHRSVVEEALDNIRAEFPDVTFDLSIVEGIPQDALLRASNTARMLVVGNHSLSPLERFFIGSVSHAVIIGLRSPVLVVPAERLT